MEHDARLIARNVGLGVQQVEDMMKHMIKLGLFESNCGVVSCLKMAKRLDKSMTSNPEMRQIIGDIKNNSHDFPSNNHDGVMQDKTSLEENKKLVTRDDVFNLWIKYFPHHTKPIPSRWNGTQRDKDFLKRLGENEKHQTAEFWEWFISGAAKIDWYNRKESKHWFNLGWIMKRSNFDKILEQANE